MKSVKLSLVLFALLSTPLLGGEPKIGDTVTITAESADVQTSQGKLGSIARGTQFVVRQKNGSWLLGQFRINRRRTLGWVNLNAVRPGEAGIEDQPVHDFTWHNLLLASAKLDEHFNLEDYVDDYLRAVRHRVWEKYRNDEFQLEKQRRETREIMRKRLSDFDANRDFLLRTQLTFEAYNFAEAMFPITQADHGRYWYENASHWSESLPSHIRVYLKEPKLIRGLPMEPDQAERFLAARKSRYGGINRTVHANLRLRMVSAKSDGLEAEVRWAQFFDDKNRTRLIYETPRSPLEEAGTTEMAPVESEVKAKNS